jgi:RNA 3'-terminal phosphate cyclase (ATP)
VGTAGSATLVLQTVLPALLTAEGPSELLLEGGTHNPWSPPFDFLQKTFLPAIETMGPQLRAELLSHGFYPAGGGRFRVTVDPVRRLSGFSLLESGGPPVLSACATVSALPGHIAEREIRLLQRDLGIAPARTAVQEVEGAVGPGNVVTLAVRYPAITEVITGFGRKGVRAETVAGEVAAEARTYLELGVPVGRHLADQLLLPMALAGNGTFRTGTPTPHTRTNIDVIQSFLDVQVCVTESALGIYTIAVGG